MLGAKIQNVIRQIDNAVQTPNGFNPEFLKNVRAQLLSLSWEAIEMERTALANKKANDNERHIDDIIA